MTTFLDPFVALLHAALLHLSAVMPGPSGVAIALALVLLTVLLRLSMLPLAIRGWRAQEARKGLAPELARLRARHAKDPAVLGEALMGAHRDAGIKPFVGMGASLAQAPALMSSYRLVMSPVIAGQANVLTTASLLGAPLSMHWLPVLTTAGLISAPGVVCVALLLALLVVAALQSRAMTDGPTALRLLPFGSLAWAALAPVAFSIYLLTSNTWTLAERTMLPRLLGA